MHHGRVFVAHVALLSRVGRRAVVHVVPVVAAVARRVVARPVQR
jgi:hypothetical protein